MPKYKQSTYYIYQNNILQFQVETKQETDLKIPKY